MPDHGEDERLFGQRRDIVADDGCEQAARLLEPIGEKNSQKAGAARIALDRTGKRFAQEPRRVEQLESAKIGAATMPAPFMEKLPMRMRPGMAA